MSRRKTPSKSNLIIVLMLLLALFVGKNTSAQTEKPDEVIKVDTNLVMIPATVLDRDGRYVTNLKKEDFQIFENGIEQEIVLFEPTEQPFTAFLLLDVSGSMSKNLIDLTNAANAFVGQLRPDDTIIAATFADDTYVQVKATKVKDLKKNIRIEQRPGIIYTRIYDAVDFALKKMKKIPGRKAIILFSDGDGDGLYATLKGNMRKAQETEASIYTMQLNTFSSLPPLPDVNPKRYYLGIQAAKDYMQFLARVTGGRAFQLTDLAELKNNFAAVAEELSRQYSLGYYPKEKGQAGEKRQIKVKSRQPNLSVRARDSYIVQPKKK